MNIFWIILIAKSNIFLPQCGRNRYKHKSSDLKPSNQCNSCPCQSACWKLVCQLLMLPIFSQVHNDLSDVHLCLYFYHYIIDKKTLNELQYPIRLRWSFATSLAPKMCCESTPPHAFMGDSCLVSRKIKRRFQNGWSLSMAYSLRQ